MARAPRAVRHVLALVIVLCLSGGCGGGKNLNTVAAKITDAQKYWVQDPDELVRPFREGVRAKRQRNLAMPPGTRPAAAEADEESRLQFLVLSGGGQYGAWGSGFLAGWAEGDARAKRPTFHVVTGISTGGLMATGALLGDDAALKRAYTTVSQRDVMRLRFGIPLTLFFADSIYSTRPLGELIKDVVTNRRIDEVARAATEEIPRKVFVASCELESGKLVIWDLSRIAVDKRYDLYRAVVLATASIPAAFPPVVIGGKRYVDGGTRSNLFLNKSVFPVLQEQDLGGQLDVSVIINGQRSMGNWRGPGHTVGIAFRSVSMLLNSSEQKDMLHIQQLVKDLSGTLRGTWIPEGENVGSEHMFDRKVMNRLYKSGVAAGREQAWLIDPHSRDPVGRGPREPGRPDTRPTAQEWDQF